MTDFARLTRRQLEALKAFAEIQDRTALGPWAGEVGDALGVSKQCAHLLIQSLVRAGMLFADGHVGQPRRYFVSASGRKRLARLTGG